MRTGRGPRGAMEGRPAPGPRPCRAERRPQRRPSGAACIVLAASLLLPCSADEDAAVVRADHEISCAADDYSSHAAARTRMAPPDPEHHPAEAGVVRVLERTCSAADCNKDSCGKSKTFTERLCVAVTGAAGSSTAVQCAGSWLEARVWSGSDQCSGRPKIQRIPLDRCLPAAAGGYVVFSCVGTPAPASPATTDAAPAPVPTSPTQPRHDHAPPPAGHVARSVCGTDGCGGADCKRDILQQDACVPLRLGRRRIYAQLHCDGEGGVRVRLHQTSWCNGPTGDGGTLPEGLCLKTRGGHVTYDCPHVPPLRRPTVPDGRVVRRVCGAANCQSECEDEEVIQGYGCVSMGLGSAMMQCNPNGLDVDVHAFTRSACQGAPRQRTMLEGGCVRHDRGWGGVAFFCPREDKCPGTELRTLPQGAEGAAAIDCHKARRPGDHCAVAAQSGYDCALLTVECTSEGYEVRGACYPDHHPAHSPPPLPSPPPPPQQQQQQQADSNQSGPLPGQPAGPTPPLQPAAAEGEAAAVGESAAVRAAEEAEGLVAQLELLFDGSPLGVLVATGAVAAAAGVAYALRLLCQRGRLRGRRALFSPDQQPARKRFAARLQGHSRQNSGASGISVASTPSTQPANPYGLPPLSSPCINPNAPGSGDLRPAATPNLFSPQLGGSLYARASQQGRQGSVHLNMGGQSVTSPGMHPFSPDSAEGTGASGFEEVVISSRLKGKQRGHRRGSASNASTGGTPGLPPHQQSQQAQPLPSPVAKKAGHMD
eukprot:TRINITY_DN2125_c0_g4_i1.p1 TRINITY_DN2125_c0_g4~~TRINITY_DN2125_c0_g4_i1.p1  ORF type:complete len:766 (+),score=170.74 TRINITY_DN2125_c0_g4_i1:61-2358(+)